MGQLAAVLGTGQTRYVAKRSDVTMAGMCCPAAMVQAESAMASCAPAGGVGSSCKFWYISLCSTS